MKKYQQRKTAFLVFAFQSTKKSCSTAQALAEKLKHVGAADKVNSQSEQLVRTLEFPLLKGKEAKPSI